VTYLSLLKCNPLKDEAKDNFKALWSSANKKGEDNITTEEMKMFLNSLETQNDKGDIIPVYKVNDDEFIHYD
jgi:hypothetical protein